MEKSNKIKDNNKLSKKVIEYILNFLKFIV